MTNMAGYPIHMRPMLFKSLLWRTIPKRLAKWASESKSALPYISYSSKLATTQYTSNAKLSRTIILQEIILWTFLALSNTFYLNTGEVLPRPGYMRNFCLSSTILKPFMPSTYYVSFNGNDTGSSCPRLNKGLSLIKICLRPGLIEESPLDCTQFGVC